MFGKLDIFWPNGPMETYELTGRNVAVGRSPGNDIVLDSPAVSRYHVTFTFDDEGNAFITDLGSVNGTYIDSRRLEPDRPYRLSGHEEIMIGDLRLIYHPPQEPEEVAKSTVTIEDTGYEATTTVVTDRVGFSVVPEATNVRVTPGTHSRLTITVQNLGDETGRFALDLSGPSTEWVRPDRRDMSIAPGEQAHVVLDIRPPRRTDLLPDRYPVNLVVYPLSHPDKTVRVEIGIEVGSYHAFRMTPAWPAPDKDIFPVLLENLGNVPLPLQVSGYDPRNRRAVTCRPDSVVLAPGQQVVVHAKVHKRRWLDLVRGASGGSIVVLAQAQNASGFVAAIPVRRR